MPTIASDETPWRRAPVEREPAEPRDAARTADKAQLALYYHQMLAIRRMEEALAKAYALRKFGGFLHL